MPSTNTSTRPRSIHGNAIAACLVLLSVILIEWLWNRYIYTTTTDLLLLSWISQVGLLFLLPMIWELAVSKRGFASLGLIWRDGWKDLKDSVFLSLGILAFTAFILGPKKTFSGGEIGPSWMIMYALSSLFPTFCIFGWCLKRWQQAWGTLTGVTLSGLAYGLLMSGDGRFRLGLFAVLVLIGMFMAKQVINRKSLLFAWPIIPAFTGLLMAQTTVEEVTTASLWEQAMFARVTIPAALICVILVGLILRDVWPTRLSVLIGGLYALALGMTLYGWSNEIPLRTAQMAKYVCSGVFISDRKAKDIQEDDMAFIRHTTVRVDRKANTVSVTYLGLGEQIALFRKRLGCTLLHGKDPKVLHKRAKSVQKLRRPRTLRWPRAVQSTTRNMLLRQRLQEFVTPFFRKSKRHPAPKTKAIVIVHKGSLLYEHYAKDTKASTPLLGHSLTKTVTGALAGILIARKKLSLKDKIFTGDSAEDDENKKKVEVKHLLHMTSGLSFSEDYLVPFSNLTVMLYGSIDSGQYALGRDVVDAPAQRWHYETGTAMLLSLAIRNSFGDKQKAYQQFPHKALFRPLGMRSAVLEQDASGTYLGGSHMYATARDWARFGQLYLRKGKWNGKQLLSPSWLSYTLTPAPTAPLGVYGVNMWLNGGSKKKSKKRWRKRKRLPAWLRVPRKLKRQVRLFPKLPSDAYFAIGYGGQIIAVFPTQQLVVVRLSHGMDETWGIPEHYTFLQGVLKAMRRTNHKHTHAR